MLNYWKDYDKIILITSWAYQVILSFRRYEVCRQPWFEVSPTGASVYCWYNCIWQNWSLIHHVRDIHISLGLCVVYFTEWCRSYSATGSKLFLCTSWDTGFLLRKPHAQLVTEVKKQKQATFSFIFIFQYRNQDYMAGRKNMQKLRVHNWGRS